MNDDIKSLKSRAGVNWATVADVLQVSEGTLFRWLRHPMNEFRKKQLEEAIKKATIRTCGDVNA